MGQVAGALLFGAAVAGGLYVYSDYQRREAERQAQLILASQPVAQPAPQRSRNNWAPVIQWGLGQLMNSENGILGGLLGGNRRTTTKPASTTTGRTRPQVTAVATPAGAAAGGSIGHRLMNDLQRDLNLSRVQAAGVVGNLDHESGGFRSLQEINPLVSGSRGGYGYAQWTGPRRRQFESWARQNGHDTRSYEANYGFLLHELTNTEERRVLPRLRSATSVDDAAMIFSGSSQRGNSRDGFLRPGIPHFESRKRRARGYL